MVSVSTLYLSSFPEACPGSSSSGANLFFQGIKEGMGGGERDRNISTKFFNMKTNLKQRLVLASSPYASHEIFFIRGRLGSR